MEKKKVVKLKKFHVTNYKGIEELSVDINGNHFMIVGANGVGKTSLLDMLDRAALRKEPADLADIPIKLGAPNAKTEVWYYINEDGKETNLLVQTIYRPSGSEIQLTDLYNNGVLKKPIETLQKFIGVTHDLTGLMDMSGDEQFKKLFEILGNGEAFTNFETQYEQKYETRKEINRDLKKIELEVSSVTPPFDIMQKYKGQGLYTEKKSLNDLPPKPDKLALVMERNNLAAKNQQRVNALEKREEIEKQIFDLQKKLRLVDEYLEDNPSIDLTEIDEKIHNVDEEIIKWEQEKAAVVDYNKMVDDIDLYNAYKASMDKKNAEKDIAQKEMNDIMAKMEAAISETKIEEIVPELKLLNEVQEQGNKFITKKYLAYKIGNEYVPFNRRQVSYGKSIVALAKLSAYINYGKFNFIRLPQWESLDEDARRDILAFANENPELQVQFGIEAVENEVLGIKIIEAKN